MNESKHITAALHRAKWARDIEVALKARGFKVGTCYSEINYKSEVVAQRGSVLLHVPLASDKALTLTQIEEAMRLIRCMARETGITHACLYTAVKTISGRV